MKPKFAVAFLIAVAFLAMIGIARTAPPGFDDRKSTAASTPVQADIQTNAAVDLRPVDIADRATDMPVVETKIPGEVTRATRHERRFEFATQLHSDWVSEVPTPPNEKTFNGFANTRAREKV